MAFEFSSPEWEGSEEFSVGFVFSDQKPREGPLDEASEAPSVISSLFVSDNAPEEIFLRVPASSREFLFSSAASSASFPEPASREASRLDSMY